jgi:hypothetical protein
MMIFVDLLLHAVEKNSLTVSRLGPSAFLDSTRTPKAGADVREYGALRSATAYGLRQNVVDTLLFTENLVAFIPEDGKTKPSNLQVAKVVGSHRRRWKRD